MSTSEEEIGPLDATVVDHGNHAWPPGRQSEFHQLLRAVDERQFVQVVGPPGSGAEKLVENLCVSAGREHLCAGQLIRFDDRPTPQRAVQQILAAYDRSATASAPSLEALVARLGREPGKMLVLDLPLGMESSVGFFDTLLERAPELKLVIASEERIPLTGSSAVVQVRGMAPPHAIPLLAQMLNRTVGSPERAGTQADFVRIVDAVDGFPLALEAIAALAHVMTLADVMARWNAEPTWVFEDLGARRAGGLHATLERSWEALADDERGALRVLSLAPPPFPADLLATPPAGSRGAHHLQLVERLVRKSWLFRTEEGGRSRFFIPAVLRRFAASISVGAGGEDSAARGRVADHVLAEIEQMIRDFERGGALEVCRRTREQQAAFLQAARAVEETAPEVALQIYTGLVRFHAAVEEVGPLLGRLEALLQRDLAERARPEVRIRAAIGLVELLQREGQVEAARRRAAHAIELANRAAEPLLSAAFLASSVSLTGIDPAGAEERLREARERSSGGEPLLRARIEIRLGYASLRDFELERAREQFRQAREMLAGISDPVVRSELAAGLGYVSFRMNRTDAAIAAFEEVLEQENAIGSPQRIADAHFNLGAVALELGRSQFARLEMERAVAQWTEGARPNMVALGQLHLGVVAALDDDYGTARERLRRALRLADRCADIHNRAVAEGTLALVALAAGDEPPPPDIFRDVLGDLIVWRTPDVAAVFRTAADVQSVFTGRRAQVGSPRGLPVSLEGLMSLLGPHDHRLRELFGALAALRVTLFDALAPEHAPEGWRSFAAEQPASNDLVNIPAEATASALGRLLGRAASRVLGSRGKARVHGPPPRDASHRLRAHPDGRWFQADDQPPVDLLTRGPLRRVLGGILEKSIASSTSGASVEELVEYGWPDESPTPESGAGRVYNVIRMLREKGLDEIVVTGDEGYRIAPDVALFLEQEEFSQID